MSLNTGEISANFNVELPSAKDHLKHSLSLDSTPVFFPEAPLSSQEIDWLNNISFPYESEETSLPLGEIVQALRELELREPAQIDEAVLALFAQHNVPAELIVELQHLVQKYRYDRPTVTLERLIQTPIALGLNHDQKFEVILPTYHDVQGGGIDGYVEGNCGSIIKHLAFQLQVLGLIDEINHYTTQQGVQVKLTLNNGTCKDLFDGSSANHWFGMLHFQTLLTDTQVVLDPSFQRIATPARYTTFAGEEFETTNVRMAVQDWYEVQPLDLNKIDYSGMAFGCSYNHRLSFGLSFHTYQNKITPVLTVIWNEEGGGSGRCDLLVNSKTQEPMCDRDLMQKFSLPERLQIVRCLALINQFTFQATDLDLIRQKHYLRLDPNG
jgi:hypothetical protein